MNVEVFLDFRRVSAELSKDFRSFLEVFLGFRRVSKSFRRVSAIFVFGVRKGKISLPF